jgi:hypothetical protein
VSHAHLGWRLIAAAFCTASIPAFAHAQIVPPACRPLLDAERKTITTPHHVRTTETSARAGQKERTTEGITTSGAIYVQYDGKWRRSPATPKQMLARMDTNLTTATTYSCTRVSDEPEAGTAATVYTAHTENEGVKADTRVWVAKGSGLVLRTEQDMDTGGGDKVHRSIRYDYTNVQAPAGVK